MNGWFEYEVFIAYASEDLPWVKQLAEKLREAGVVVFFDKWEIKLGENFVTAMERGLTGSAAGIVVLSPDAVASPWVEEERSVLVRRSKDDPRRMVVPVLYRDCTIPPFLGNVQRVDFRDQTPANQEQALQELLCALRRQPLPKRIRTRGRLTKVLMQCVLVVCLPAIAMAALVGWRSQTKFESLRGTQREVQAMEETIALPASWETRALKDGQKTYRETAGSHRIVTDTWRNGALVWRDFIVNEHLLARDEFLYDGRTLVGKMRQYMGADQAVFLEDSFTQDGRLTRKRYFPDGAERPAVVYMDQMQSPLPPSNLIFYR